ALGDVDQVHLRPFLDGPPGFPGGRGGAGFPPAPGLPMPVALPQAAPTGAPPPRAPVANGPDPAKTDTSGAAPARAAPVKPREYSREAALGTPGLIPATRAVPATPWPSAASTPPGGRPPSASSRGGLLGGTDTPLRVFQDFFVALDLPLYLTQNDEVAFPVA